MTDLLLRIDGKFTASIPLLMESTLIKCVLATVLRRSLQRQSGKSARMYIIVRIVLPVSPQHFMFCSLGHFALNSLFKMLITSNISLTICEPHNTKQALSTLSTADRSEQPVLGCVRNDGCNSILSRFIVIVCEFLGK